MTDFVHIEPADDQRRAFARWALSQTPKLQTSSSTGTDVPVDLYPDVPVELLEGAFVDGYRYGGPAAPQPDSGTTPAPEPTTAARASQAASSGPARKPRKRAARKPRKAATSKLTAEQLADEAGPDVAAAADGSSSADSASE